MRIRLLLAIATLTAAVATGCTTTKEGTPLPDSNAQTDSSSDSTPDELPTDGAPKVENPLDVSHFEQQPCDALTAEQTQELNVPATGDLQDNGAGKTCYWRNSDTRGMVGLFFFSEIEDGLSSVYREAKTKNFPYFEPIGDIEGYPAVAFDTKEEKSAITCSVSVGVTDRMAFTVIVSLSDSNIGHKEPCAATKQVAGLMMKTMKEAA